ncbi:MAG: ribosome hibernation-promoting factor, HPF/YfiA family [Brevinema sp.]
MTIIVAGQKFTITPQLKDFIDSKVQTRFAPFASRIHNVNITVAQEHITFKADCKVTSDFGDFHSTGQFDSPEASIDKAVDVMVTEIRKKHDKIVDKHTGK